jgi:hypothetical protein
VWADDEKECKKAFQNGNFKAGGVGFKVRVVFQGVEIDGTRDVFPAG